MTIDNLTSWVALLQFFATSAGAGWAATALVGWLRRRYPAPLSQPDSRLARAWYLALHAPRYTRYTVLGLTLGIGAASAWLLGLVTGADTTPLLNGFGAFAFSQVLHGLAALAPELPAAPLSPADRLAAEYGIPPAAAGRLLAQVQALGAWNNDRGVADER